MSICYDPHCEVEPFSLSNQMMIGNDEGGMEMIGKKIVHRVMMHGPDGHYASTLISGAKMLHMFDDLSVELMRRAEGDPGMLLGYDKIRFNVPVHVSDFVEYHAWIEKKNNTSYVVQFEAYKILTTPDDFKDKRKFLDAFATEEPNLLGLPDSAMLVLNPPVLIGSATGIVVVAADKQKGPQDPAFAVETVEE